MPTSAVGISINKSPSGFTLPGISINKPAPGFTPLGISINKPAPGFTLLEVLVTLVLIGIIASIAVISLRASGTSDRLADEATRLTALAEQNRHEALLNGEQRGIRFSETGYAFEVRDRARKWLPSDASGVSQQVRLPGDMRLTLRVEGRLVDFSDDDPSAPPHVLFLSSGEATDFSVTLTSETLSGQYRVAGDVAGALTVGPMP